MARAIWYTATMFIYGRAVTKGVSFAKMTLYIALSFCKYSNLNKPITMGLCWSATPTSAKSTAFQPTTTNGASVFVNNPEQYHHAKQPPSWCPAKVIRVIDGDTVVLLIGYPVDHVIEPSRSHQDDELQLTKSQRIKRVWLDRTVRLSGVDAAEHNTTQGQKASALLIAKLHSLKELWACVESKPDKYGRTLAGLFDHENATTPIWEEWNNVPIEGFGIVMSSYNGGTKSDYMKKLPVVASTPHDLQIGGMLPADGALAALRAVPKKHKGPIAD